MNRICLRLLPLLLLLHIIAGCSAGQHIALPYPQGGPRLVHFGSHVQIKEQNIPIQGEFRLTKTKGILVAMLPHGSPLGQCHYQPHEDSATSYDLICTSTMGDPNIKEMLTKVGVALYRLFASHDTDPLPATITAQDWQGQCKPTQDDFWFCKYQENTMHIDFYVTEYGKL